MAKLLEVDDLATYFYTPEGVVKAVDGVTYDLEEGEVLALAVSYTHLTLPTSDLV